MIEESLDLLLKWILFACPSLKLVKLDIENFLFILIRLEQAISKKSAHDYVEAVIPRCSVKKVF